MKALSRFLALYIILLSLLPCADVVSDNNVQKIGFFKNMVNNPMDNVDHCSPFCTCQCCQGNFFTSTSPVIQSAPVVRVVYFESTLDFQSVDLFDFFTPPKA
ncbi:MAG: hypothetical protein Q8867_06500 [Bacteroidota bacterium]|nr:hypothetical protein [Bacteroidota bacterium]